MSNPLKTELRFARRHTATYKGTTVAFVSKYNPNGYLGRDLLLYDGVTALRSAGCYINLMKLGWRYDVLIDGKVIEG